MIAAAADGTRLHYIVEGTGPPLVLIGGRTSTIEGAWWRYIPALSPRFKVIALDNRGTGGSDKPDTPYSTALMADDALTILRDACPARAYTSWTRPGTRSIRSSLPPCSASFRTSSRRSSAREPKRPSRSPARG